MTKNLAILTPPNASTLPAPLTSPKRRSLSGQLLRWYAAHGRDLPWRVRGGGAANPYHVLLSEFMLQQTQVSTVLPYFAAFTQKWPTLEAFAAADLEAIRALWSGLGYYRRAGFLHACAKSIVQDHGGVLPAEEAVLRRLPGIGAYTAAALRAFVHHQPANVVDGNVERVMARLFAVTTPLPAAKNQLAQLAATLVPKAHCSDYAQALMDLGSSICTPRQPICTQCPWQADCKAYAGGNPEAYPYKTAKAKIPQKYAACFVLMNGQGKILLHKREEGGLLAGLWQFPATPFLPEPPSPALLQQAQPCAIAWQNHPTLVRHVFSHFKLEVAVFTGKLTRQKVFLTNLREYRWLDWPELATIGLPSLMRKIATIAQTVLVR